MATLSAAEAVERAARTGVLKGLRAEKALAAAAAVRRAIKLAVGNKVQMAMGSDSGVVPHGTNGREFVLLVQWGGMSNMDAIVAGTSSNAKLLGWEKNVGSLTPGKWADIVAVSGDPLQRHREYTEGCVCDEERRDLQALTEWHRYRWILMTCLRARMINHKDTKTQS